MIHILFFSLLGQLAFYQSSEVGHGLLAVALLITEQPVEKPPGLVLVQPVREGRSHHRHPYAEPLLERRWGAGGLDPYFCHCFSHCSISFLVNVHRLALHYDFVKT
jgi:hypothetical protein